MSKGSRRRPTDAARWKQFWDSYDEHGGLRGQLTKKEPWCDSCSDTGRTPDGEPCTECKQGLMLRFGDPAAGPEKGHK